MMIEHLQSRAGAWATANEIAMEVGHPWRVVARSLMRVQMKHPKIEQKQFLWKSTRHRTRDCNQYRLVDTNQPEYPTWLMPRLPT